MHGEGERGEKDICSSYMYTYADAVTWFPDPVLVAEFRIRHYAAELYDSGIQKYKTGIVHISLRAVPIEEEEKEMCTGREREGKRIYVAVTCTRMQIAVTWFPDPVLVAEFRIRHYAAELYDSGIQKYKTGIVHISLRAVPIEEEEKEMCTGREREGKGYM